MKVLMEGKTFRVNWQHLKIEDADKPWDHATICYVRLDEKMLACSSSHCSRKDQFKKATGRKISLRRALGVTTLSKNQRRVFWEAYLTEVGC